MDLNFQSFLNYIISINIPLFLHCINYIHIKYYIYFK